ncbi:LLM class F420-dependent oxidoreductase [Actinokineospora iranica]|uniref:Probable F420-dependent oxidoreductase, MSMEG_4141 family n=1 Tax=Actinokineospora iranica TaxID=1271860 RepID=A0A1G6Q835_9PSEU|nr:LLM class F420-dependent oxidoreductase [Actinokineospora iranica]SDC87866.1 probable F420-dependent oxidoreductase, MSMEG_4141 family [Actinokineospora iranica]
MAVELGRIGIWSLAYLWPDQKEAAAELEELGFGALWLGALPDADLGLVERLLDATKTMAIGPSIVNVWTAAPAAVATEYDRISTRHPDRFILGVGSSHKPIVETATAETYERPLSKLADYLDQLAVPARDVAVAALGPKAIRLAGERSRGALPYLVTPEHTARAREILGDGPLLAPEQHVLLETDPRRARETARQALDMYLKLPNYVRNWRRLGFSEDDVKGSDHLIDALVAWGDEDAVLARVDEHFAAGADHVALQVVTPDGGLDREAYRRLAAAIG